MHFHKADSLRALTKRFRAIASDIRKTNALMEASDEYRKAVLGLVGKSATDVLNSGEFRDAARAWSDVLAAAQENPMSVIGTAAAVASSNVVLYRNRGEYDAAVLSITSRISDRKD